MKKEDIIRNSLSVFLASSVLDLYPGAKPLKGGITETGFYYDFILKEKIDLVYLEERIHQKKNIKSFSMIGENAAVYLEHLGCRDKIKEVRSFKKEVIDLVQVDNFVTIKKGPFTDNFFFKLYQAEEKNGITRIFGDSFNEEKILKEKLKKKVKYKKNNHCVLAEKLDLFYFEKNECIFGKRGVILKNLFLDFLKKKHNFLKVDILPIKENFKFLREKKYKNFSLEQVFYRKKHPFFMGMYNREKVSLFSEFIFFKKEKILDEIIYSLNFLKKILDDLELDYNIFVEENFFKETKHFFKDLLIEKFFEKDCLIKIFIKDAQDWSHLGFSIYKKDFLEYTVLERRFGPIEDLICIILENTKGDLPKYLLPEVVRLLPLSNMADEYAKKIEKVFIENKINVLIDDLGSLEKRIFLAKKNRIPYIVFVGEKELKIKNIFLDKINSDPLQMDVDSIIKKIKDLF